MMRPRVSNEQIDPAVPFNELARGTAVLRREIDIAIERVISSGWYVLGPEHDKFELELSRYLGVHHAVGVGNGTDALQLALTALGVSPGDTVLTAANAGGYTSTACRSLGATPVYADVDPSTMLLTVATLDAALRLLPSKPAVVVVTHLYGAAANAKDIVSWAHSHGIAVVEDCAQSLGAFTSGVRAGSLADVATTSFYPTKNLGALGDGGAIFTSDKELATRLRELRQYGWSSKYRTTRHSGRNSRLDELQAAILRAKLPFLDANNQTRREIHLAYEASIGTGARLVNHADESFVGHLAVIDVEDRTRATAILSERGIRHDIHYPIADHQQPIAVGSGSVPLPVTEAAVNRVLSVPLFPELTPAEVSRVSAALAAL
jgi:aminotransferase EvaB